MTYHNDNTREGQEYPGNRSDHNQCHSSTFGKVGLYSTDGKVDAEPLYLPGVMIGGATHNVLYVVTETIPPTPLMLTRARFYGMFRPWAPGETTSDPRNCGQVSPEIGMTSTPVIDPKQARMGPSIWSRPARIAAAITINACMRST